MGKLYYMQITKLKIKTYFGNSKLVELKSMLELYPEIDVIKDIHDENPGLVQNCAEESESKPQAMMANVRNGELLASITYQLSTNQGFANNIWTSDVMAGKTVTNNVQ